jgi:glycosyltransferase involved in cell wall biosynthesis
MTKHTTTLSVLVSGVPSRLASGPPASLSALWAQAGLFEDVEVLYLVDNKRRSVGEKRNALLSIARGDYVSYVDDDDAVSDDYVSKLREAAVTGADVIVFPVRVTLNGQAEGVVEPSVREPVQEQYRPGAITKRRPIQIACWRRALVADIRFPDVQWGEDHALGDLASARVQTEYRVDSVLYHYKYDESVSEAVR